MSISTTNDSRTQLWFAAQDEAQKRALVRGVALSVVLHVVLGVMIAYAPKPEPTFLPEVISVRMVSMPAAAAPAQPKAVPATPKAPEPVPAKPRPAPLPKQVILPKQPAVVTKKPKPKPKPLDYDDALDALREELGDEEPLLQAPPQEVAEIVGDPSPVQDEGVSGQVDPVIAAWKLAVRRHMADVWVVPEDFKGQGLQTTLLVTLSAGGDVLGKPSVVRASGNPYFDDNILRALVRATPLPAPPETGDWPFEFSADE